MGLLIPLFWTSGGISSGFQSQSGKPYSHLAEAYMLHVSGVTPADLLAASMAAKPTLVELEWETYRATGERSTD